MPREQSHISGIAVRGFKSISAEQYVEIRPLTILAGANSSGKSSVMQPLLLLKQTLESPGDPGALRLDGPNVRFTSTDQLLSRATGKPTAEGFSIRLDLSTGESLATDFRAEPGRGFETERMVFKSPRESLTIRPGMTHEEIVGVLPSHLKKLGKRLSSPDDKALRWSVHRDRCFLGFDLADPEEDGGLPHRLLRTVPRLLSPSNVFISPIERVIHLPGQRGNPRRTYPKTAAGPFFPGTFEDYVASIISQWQAEKSERLAVLGHTLKDMGLSWKVTAKAVDATQVELRVGRLVHSSRGGARDLVSIADAGFGVSQSLPVVVALVAADPGQLVYLEQPEIHLHPQAQRRLAHALCQAAKCYCSKVRRRTPGSIGALIDTTTHQLQRRRRQSEQPVGEAPG